MTRTLPRPSDAVAFLVGSAYPGPRVSGGPKTDETVSAALPRAASTPGAGAAVFVVACGHQPLVGPARLLLGGLGEVQLRRGAALAYAAGGGGGELAIPDREVSSRHARLTRIGAGWAVEDLGSKNGTFVNGDRVKVAALADGDVIDVGRAVLRFRDRVAQAGAPFVQPVARRGLTSLVPALEADLAELERMAPSPITILIEGETGTGKEVMARLIHARSGRPGDFVGVNCGALARERVEAELFGWKRGAFPGAGDHLGLVRAADQGTLFLDEIGDLPLRDQAALLRVLQEREVLPIGATRAVPVDLRVVAATNRPLDAMARRGEFRDDLLARLAGYRLRLAPLRERREDLGLLVADLLRDHGAPAGIALATEALRALLAHGWPGNVRELDHAIAHALVQCQPETTILARHLPRELVAAPDDAPADDGDRDDGDRDDDALRAQLVALLHEHRGNTAAVARAMGKAPMQIWRWLKRFDIDAKSLRR